MDNILSGITELIAASGFEDEITQILHCQLDEEEITGIFQAGDKKLGYRISSALSTVFELGSEECCIVMAIPREDLAKIAPRP